MADHLQIARSLARLKGRPAVDQPQRPTPATLGELLAWVDEPAHGGRSDRAWNEKAQVRNAAASMGRKGPPCRQRRGGPLVLLTEPQGRWAPPVVRSEGGLARAADWARGATAWMRKHKLIVDDSWPVAATGPLCVLEDDKRSKRWLCQLSRRFDEAFEHVTGHRWFDMVCADPLEVEDGLAQLADSDAYIDTYDVQAAGDANSALLMLDAICGQWGGQAVGDIQIGQFEILREACCELRLPPASAAHCIRRLALNKDKWALPVCWHAAIDGVIAFGEFTDGPWLYDGDLADCSADAVTAFKDTLKYFEFVEQLVGARAALYAAVNPLIKHVVNKPERFWREFARSIHDTIEAHPDWSIPLKEEGPSSRLIDVLAGARTDRNCRVPVKL